MAIKWNLRRICADRNIWTAAELQRLLKEKTGLQLTHTPVNYLYKKTPTSLSLKTLYALCYVLECTPNDLIEFDYSNMISFEDIEQKDLQAVNGENAKSERNKNKGKGPFGNIPLPPI